MYEFGSFRVDPDHRQLLRDERPIPIQPKAFELLLVLVQNSEKVLLKEDLLKAVWPDTFVEESNLAQNIFVLRKALGDATAKNQYIVTVPGRGYRFAEKVTEIHSPAEQVVVETQSIQKVTIEERARPAGRMLWVGAAVLALGACFIAYRAYKSAKAIRPAALTPSSAVPGRRLVAVLGFRDLSGRSEDAWLATALPEMLNTELGQGNQVRLVSAEEVARTKLDLLLRDADSFSKDTLDRVHRRLGTDVVVLGSFATLGGSSKNNLRLDLRAQDAVAGETIAEVSATGGKDDLFDLVSHAGMQLREKLGLGALSLEEAVRVKTSLPANPEAARLYAEGLNRLRSFDALAARDLLQRSLQADASYPLTRVALSSAWSSLGYDKQAQEQANEAFRLSRNLPHEDQLLVEGAYRIANHEYDKAIDLYRTLFTLFPDNLEYGLRLAAAQGLGSKALDSLDTVQLLRKLPPPASGDPRIDLQEAENRVAVGNFQQALLPLNQAFDKASALGARSFAALARERQCRALSHLGQTEKAVASCREARDTYAATGNPAGEATALRSWADTIADVDPHSAMDLYREAAERFGKIGNLSGLAATLNSLGLLQTDQGDLTAAEKTHSQALDIYKRLNDKQDVGKVLGNMANERLYEGDLSVAQNLYQEASLIDRESGDSDGAAVQLYNEGNVQELRGNLAGAKQDFLEALVEFQKGGNSYSSGYALFSLGQVALKQGDFDAAQHAADESLKIRKGSGEQVLIGESEMLLAELSFEQGRALKDLESSLQQIAGAFEKQNERDDEAQAWDLLARVLIAEKNLSEAAQASEKSAACLKKSKNFEILAGNRITAARIRGLQALSGNHLDEERALQRQLASVVSEARQRGYAEVVLEARLAQAELAIMTDQKSTAERQLLTIENEAQSKGFGLIARKARAIRSS